MSLDVERNSADAMSLLNFESLEAPYKDDSSFNDYIFVCKL